MKIYKCRSDVLPGSDFREINKHARNIIKGYVGKTKRKPYVRSAYFDKEKIFLDFFWAHLWQTNWGDRVRRLKYINCGLELIVNSRNTPVTKQNPNNSREYLHRFGGVTQSGELFFVQIKERKKTGRKYLMSVFPKDY